jgi:hypothetical protein
VHILGPGGGGRGPQAIAWRVLEQSNGYASLTVSNGSNGERLDEVEERHQALVERLRRLRWPEPPSGVRERRLAELRDILARGAPQPTGPKPEDQS